MKTYLWIAYRYLINNKGKKFFSLMSLVSILGVAIGVMTLIVVLGVMSGFDRDLKSKILGLNYDIVIDKDIGILSKDALFEKVASFKQITGFSPFVSGQVLLSSKERFMGVHIRGIELEKESEINNIASYIKVGPPIIGNRQLLVGEELLTQMDLRLGEKVVVFSPVANKHYTFSVAGIFKSGYYDYDLNLVFASIDDAQEILFMEGLYSGVGIKSSNSYKVAHLAEELRRKLGPDYRMRTWMDLNRNFFAALKLEKITMFIILTLIILVAAFNIISTLSVLVTNKTKDIGILKSIGISSKGINKIFMLEGVLIGILGMILGTTVGVSLCKLLGKYQFIKLPADIYYIQYLPVYLKAQDVIIIISAAFLICLVFTIYPARKAARLQPVEALRYE